MASNSISYEGRIISVNKESRDPEPLKFSQTEGGMFILELLLVEQHSMKKSQAIKDPELKKLVDANPKNKSKGADDYVDTTSTWHKITIFGDKAAEYAQNQEFNHSALVTVTDASYTEESPWETTQNGQKAFRAGRPETIGDRKGTLEIKFPAFDDAQDVGPAWDGESAVPKPGGSRKGSGGGSSSMPSVEDGF